MIIISIIFYRQKLVYNALKVEYTCPFYELCVHNYVIIVDIKKSEEFHNLDIYFMKILIILSECNIYTNIPYYDKMLTLEVYEVFCYKKIHFFIIFHFMIMVYWFSLNRNDLGYIFIILSGL